jgi:hypothetical protein
MHALTTDATPCGNVLTHQLSELSTDMDYQWFRVMLALIWILLIPAIDHPTESECRNHNAYRATHENGGSSIHFDCDSDSEMADFSD